MIDSWWIAEFLAQTHRFLYHISRVACLEALKEFCRFLRDAGMGLDDYNDPVSITVARLLVKLCNASSWLNIMGLNQCDDPITGHPVDSISLVSSGDKE